MVKFIVGFTLLFSFLGFAQVESLQSYSLNDGMVSIKTNHGTYSIHYYANCALETSFLGEDEAPAKPSHAIVAKPIAQEIRVTRDVNNHAGNPHFQLTKSEGNSISFSLDSIPFKIHYYFKNEPIVHHERLNNLEQGYELTLGISENEILYGGGARALGMNRRGNKLELYNRAHYGYETHAPLMNFCIPMYLSSKGYAVHFDAPGTGWLDLDSDSSNRVIYSTVSSRKTYQIVADEHWDGILENWTDLTGRQPKLPIWALGNFASRFGYHSRNEVEALVDQFKEENIPLDAVVLDLYWFGKTIKGTMGNLAFDRDSFPDPKGMLARLSEKNIKTVVVTEPFILTTSNRWEEATKNNAIAKDASGEPLIYDFYFGNTGLIDVFDSTASDWFWKRYLELKQMGVTGFWGDLGEPEVHPDEMIHAIGSAREVHNIYGHKWAQLVYDGLIKNFPNERPFILMRAGYAGSQRYGLIPWSGDVNRTWGGLRSQPEIALQMGMQGIPYMHSDLGGFAGANDDPELYVRWLQYGVFQPIFRPHAQEEVASEPIFKDDETKRRAKQAIELRYRLLPYNYTLMCEASKTGMPLMRPVFFNNNSMNGSNIYAVDSSYFWGDAFFIAPVLSKGQKSKTIHLPNGSNWFNFYSHDLAKGGTALNVELSMENIPTFVKGESFVPMVEGLQNTSEYSPSNVAIHYFADPESKLGEGSFEYDNGGDVSKPEIAQDRIQFKSNWKGRKGTITATSENEQTEKLNVVLHFWSGNITKIKVNGKKMKIEKGAKNLELDDLQLITGMLKIKMKIRAPKK